MSDSNLYRKATLARADDTGRTIFGRVVPYGETIRVDDGFGPYKERFERGAFARSIRERGDKVRLFAVHSSMTRLPIGKAVDLTERADGLHASFLLPHTRDADEALELVRTGTVDSFSIGFRPVRHRREGDVTVRTEAALREVSLVGLPAYAGAEVQGVRSASTSVSVDIAARRLDLILKAW